MRPVNSLIKILFTGMTGLLYLSFGIFQIGMSILPGIADTAAVAAIPPDMLGGFVLCIIGAVFLSGSTGMRSGTEGAVAYLFVGLLLSLAFGLVALLSFGAGWLEAALFGDGEEWPMAGLLEPMIFLAVISVIGYVVWGREFFMRVARA